MRAALVLLSAVLLLGLVGCKTSSEEPSQKLSLVSGSGELTTGSISAKTLPVAPGVERWYAERGVAMPHGDRLAYCHGFGCEFKTAIEIPPEEEVKVAAIFGRHASSPAEERIAIDLADQWWEKLAAPQLGGPPDKRGSELGDAHKLGQTDCIDEATNTTSLLLWLEGKGMLRHHHVQRPESRGAFLYAHATAVMTDTSTGQDWVADSWMRDSGDPIDVMTLETWFSRAYVDPVS